MTYMYKYTQLSDQQALTSALVKLSQATGKPRILVPANRQYTDLICSTVDMSLQLSKEKETDVALMQDEPRDKHVGLLV